MPEIYLFHPKFGHTSSVTQKTKKPADKSREKEDAMITDQVKYHCSTLQQSIPKIT